MPTGKLKTKPLYFNGQNTSLVKKRRVFDSLLGHHMFERFFKAFDQAMKEFDADVEEFMSGLERDLPPGTEEKKTVAEEVRPDGTKVTTTTIHRTTKSYTSTRSKK